MQDLQSQPKRKFDIRFVSIILAIVVIFGFIFISNKDVNEQAKVEIEEIIGDEKPTDITNVYYLEVIDIPQEDGTVNKTVKTYDDNGPITCEVKPENLNLAKCIQIIKL